LRIFLAEHGYLRGKERTRAFFDLINPLDSEASWQALVALNLPRGGWNLLAVPALLAATALVTGATLLLAPFASPLAGILLAVVALLAILLGFDAYASTVRSVLGEPAAEAATELRRTLAVMAAVDDALLQIRSEPIGVPLADDAAEIG
jgi:membrane protein implicated in regulation of membrane protease activity